MKHILYTLLIIATFLSSCNTTKNAYTDYSADAKLENALLWKIEGKSLEEPSYLYGTIHMIDSEEYFLPSGTLAAIDDSEQMVFEIDMNEMNDLGAIMGIMSKAFMKDGLTLKDLLNEEEYQLVNDHFNKIGMPLMMLERIKPMFLSVFAYGDIDPGGLQSGTIKSYEMEFFEMANNKGMPVDGLETIEFQMSIFDEIPYEDQAQILVETIRSSEMGSDQMDAMVQVYKDQDITTMASMLQEEDPQMAKHEDILLTKRNKNWIAHMEEMMGAQQTFFAVGAGHLGGVNGVIKLLRKAGYTVSPISDKE